MMPVYMDSSQPRQMRPPQGHYHQGFGNNNPHHMTPASSCECWPTLSPCYGSCIHGNFPPYNAYWPPCYPPPQVQYHQPCCVNHSGFHPHASHAPPYYIQQPFPAGYQPGYDSEKDVPGKLCFGKCSPQMCYPRSERGVVIEEHEPGIERGNQGEAVLPFRSTNCSYPIIWIPHENASSLGSESHDQPPAEAKDPENMKIQKSDPRLRNGFFPFDESTVKSLIQNGKTVELPFDISKLKSVLQGQDGKEVQSQKSKDEQNQDTRKVQNGKTVELPFDIRKLKSFLQGQDGKEVQIQKNKEEQSQDMGKVQNGKTVDLPFDISKLKSLLQSQDGNEVQSQKNREEQSQDMEKMQNGKTVELPFDIRKLKSLLQSQDGNEVQIQKNKEVPGQLQYPIFWIPSHGKREDVEASESKECSNEELNLKSFPSDLQLNEGQITQSKGKEGNFESNVLSDAEGKSSVRNIPVEKHIQEPRNIPVELSEKYLSKPTEPTKKVAKTEPVENTRKEQSSSSSKAPRLPPVCLRVDPLPKKKNGGSKSLSHPTRQLTSEETKVASPLSSKEAESRTVPPEASNVICEETNKKKMMSEGCINSTGTEKESVKSNSSLQGGANCEIVKPCATKESREKPAKKTFTEEEAARVIQSKYRGYDLRRWEPLKKLKEIATVREQMCDVKRRVKELEVSTDQHIEEKEIVILGEMVMSLLLKLDSVQGLHPNIRDYRKSLARELSGIQDKVDSLKKSSTEKEAVEEHVEITSQSSEQSQLAEENKMVSGSNTEKVLLTSPEEHPLGVMNTEHEQLAAEEEGPGLSETLAMNPEPVTETSICEAVATSTTIPEKTGEVETVLQVNPSSAVGNGMTVTNIEESKVMAEEALEEPSHKLPQLVEPTPRSGFEGPENATEVYETEEGKGDDDTVLPPEKDVELPVEQLAAEAVEGTGLSETLATDLESATETSICEVVATSTTIPEKTGEAETILPINPLAVDGNEMTMMKSEEDKVMVEEPRHVLLQVVEPTCGLGFEGPENATEVSETEADTSENEEGKGDNDTVLPSEKDVDLSELLPVGVIDDETQLPSQNSSSLASETASQEEINVDHSPDNSKGIEQETSEPQEEKEQSRKTEVIAPEISEETKKLMKENQRFKETMETLVKAGREQLEVISKLTSRVKSLEKKLSKKKRKQIGLRKPYRGKQATNPMSTSSTNTVL